MKKTRYARRGALGRRLLINEPLTIQDWRLVYEAYLCFQLMVESIVNIARVREVKPVLESSTDPQPAEKAPQGG